MDGSATPCELSAGEGGFHLARGFFFATARETQARVGNHFSRARPHIDPVRLAARRVTTCRCFFCAGESTKAKRLQRIWTLTGTQKAQTDPLAAQRNVCASQTRPPTAKKHALHRKSTKRPEKWCLLAVLARPLRRSAEKRGLGSARRTR